jgi:hypothetical protein
LLHPGLYAAARVRELKMPAHLIVVYDRSIFPAPYYRNPVCYNFSRNDR